MAKKKRSGPGGVPWSVVAAGLHIASDYVLKATCPRCGGQVCLLLQELQPAGVAEAAKPLRFVAHCHQMMPSTIRTSSPKCPCSQGRS